MAKKNQGYTEKSQGCSRAGIAVLSGHSFGGIQAQRQQENYCKWTIQ